MNKSQRSSIIATGLAMFSMFFGAGNVVFPLALGQNTESMNAYAICGLLITAVGVPFLGLLAMTLYNGCYQSFFSRMGKIPGFLVALVIMALIGPFGAIPRCITLSYSTLSSFYSLGSLPLFSALSCLLIYIFTYKRKNIVDILGIILTPILLGSLALIIVAGIWFGPSAAESAHTPASAFTLGLVEGYQTMDLLGAFFFSSVVILGLKNSLPKEEQHNNSKLIAITLQSSLIGAGLLTLVYIGFSYVSACNGQLINDVSKDQLISHIATTVMGSSAGLIACIAVAMACLTTAIALTAVFAEFLHEDIAQKKIDYKLCLIATLLLTFGISTLEFTGIAKILVPILEICYPAMIVLSGCNIAYKLWGVRIVKTPVLLTFAGTLLYYSL